MVKKIKCQFIVLVLICDLSVSMFLQISKMSYRIWLYLIVINVFINVNSANTDHRLNWLHMVLKTRKLEWSVWFHCFTYKPHWNICDLKSLLINMSLEILSSHYWNDIKRVLHEEMWIWLGNILTYFTHFCEGCMKRIC